MSFTWITFVYFLVVTITILFNWPVIAYYSNKMWKFRHEPFFNKRYPELTIIGLVAFQFCIIMRIIAELHELVPEVHYGAYRNFIYPYFGQSVFLLEISRLWFLFFDYNRSLQLIESEWTSKIADTSYWTIKYYIWFSYKSKRLFYIAIIWSVVAEIIAIISMHFQCDINH
eukprot:153692_1